MYKKTCSLLNSKVQYHQYFNVFLIIYKIYKYIYMCYNIYIFSQINKTFGPDNLHLKLKNTCVN